MTSIEPVLLLAESTLPGAALLLCFALFVVIGLRVFVLGKQHYEPISRVPLSDDKVIEPRPARVVKGDRRNES